MMNPGSNMDFPLFDMNSLSGTKTVGEPDYPDASLSFMGAKLWDRTMPFDPSFSLDCLPELDALIEERRSPGINQLEKANFDNFENNSNSNDSSKMYMSTSMNEIFNCENGLHTPPHGKEFLNSTISGVTRFQKELTPPGRYTSESDSYMNSGSSILDNISDSLQGDMPENLNDLDMRERTSSPDSEVEKFRVSTIGIGSEPRISKKTSRKPKKKHIFDPIDDVFGVAARKSRQISKKACNYEDDSDYEDERKPKKTKRRSRSTSQKTKKDPSKKKGSKITLFAYDDSEFDPEKHKFDEDDLKPSPIGTKGQKTVVPGHMKDDRYWARREKNNLAAKRSRDARRMKENQIAMRAQFLEDQHEKMSEELAEAKKTIAILKKKLQRYENPDN